MHAIEGELIKLTRRRRYTYSASSDVFTKSEKTFFLFIFSSCRHWPASRPCNDGEGVDAAVVIVQAEAVRVRVRVYVCTMAS